MTKGDIVRRRVIVSLALAAVMALGVTASAELAGHVFPDVPDDHVFANGIEWAKDNGLVVGYDNGNFGPEDNVTRGQIVTIMKRYHDQLGGSGGSGGAVGPVGPVGPAGAQGDPGITLVDTRLTEENPLFGDVRVVDVPGEGTGSNNFTVELFPSVTLEEGTYYVESTVQFFDFTGTTGEGPEYGLARSFLDGAPLGTLWTSDIPDDGDNAAHANGSLIVEVPAGGGTLMVQVLIRGQVPQNPAGQAGGNLIVTRFND